MFAIMGLKLVLVDGKSISSRMTLDDGSTAPGRFTDGFLYLAQGRSAEEVAEQLASVWTAALYPGVVPAGELRPGSPGGHLWGVPAPKFE